MLYSFFYYCIFSIGKTYYYYRSVSLSYEVDDYFLDVSDEMSNFLVEKTTKITEGVTVYADRYNSYFQKDSEEYWELIKQILIVVLCGVNEFYRKHQYEDGLNKAKIVKEFFREYPKNRYQSRGGWSGLKGLCSFITGKIYTALGKFTEADLEFSESVEAYSESIWQKEQIFSQFQMTAAKSQDKEVELKLKREHDISRSVALRRIGLVTAFGYGFQSLVLGKVKDAIRLSSIARGIVNWNTGKIWSAYVDLIYFSAKRAENSSDYDSLQHIKENLNRCLNIFDDLIPEGHYKNRALFQIALADHYLARWHKEKGEEFIESDVDKAMEQYELARGYWNQAVEGLNTTINDEKLKLNKRLRAESMAILGHAYSNLGLLEKRVFQKDGTSELNKATDILEKAWNEASEYPQIMCEVGLAQAAVGKAQVEYLRSGDSTKDAPTKINEQKINEHLKNSFQVLHKVLHLNKESSVRIEATAYLRLTELALLSASTHSQAYEYFNKYKKISGRVEHEFCYRWANELAGEVLNSFSFKINPGIFFNKQELDDNIDKYFVEYAVYHAAVKIEKDFLENGKFKENNSISSYLKEELSKNFSLYFKAGKRLYDKYNMYARVRQISPNAEKLPDILKRREENENGE
jgi:hypothetical protein